MLFVPLVVASLGLCAPAQVTVSTASELQQALQLAKPGTVIELKGDGINGGVHVRDVHGTQAMPIVLRGATERPTITGGGSGLQLTSVSHLTIENLRFKGQSGNGLNIDDGGEIDKPSHHVKILNVEVSDLPRGNHDGIKLSGIEDFLVVNCKVERWGGSAIDMVGCHRGKIADCDFREGGDNAVQTKGGSSEVVVTGCRFEDFGQRGVNIGGSTGMPYFRPAVTSMPKAARYEAKSISVSDCTFVRGGAPFAFVGVDGATVNRNTIYMPGRWVVRILQETTDEGFVPCRSGVFSKNLVVFRSDNWSAGGFNVGPGTEPGSFKFSENFWYCVDQPQLSQPRTPTPELKGTYGQDPLFTNAEKGKFLLKPGSPAIGYGASPSQVR